MIRDPAPFKKIETCAEFFNVLSSFGLYMKLDEILPYRGNIMFFFLDAATSRIRTVASGVLF